MKKRGIHDFIWSIRSLFQCHKLFCFQFSHRKAFKNIYVMKEYEKKKKLGDCWITDEIIKQRNHHSSFEILQKRKDGYWIIYWSGSDRTCIFSISSMEGKINSIVEPYAIRKRCLYGCSILSLFVFFIILYLSRLIVRDRGNLYYVKSSG